MKRYGFELPPFAAVFDRVLVVPLGDADQPTTTADGLLVIPPVSRERAGAQIGVIVSAGVKAIEQLYSHGIGIGDIVLLARFSEWPKAYFDKQGRPWQVLILQAGEIAASLDLKSELDLGDIWYEMNQDSGKIHVHENGGNATSSGRVDPPTIDIGEGV